MAPEPTLGGTAQDNSRLSRSLSRKQLGRIESGQLARSRSNSIDSSTVTPDQATSGALSLLIRGEGPHLQRALHHAWCRLQIYIGHDVLVGFVMKVML